MVFKIVAQTGKGVKELVKAMEELIKARSSSYKELERKRVEAELSDMVLNIVGQKVYEKLGKSNRYQECIDQLLKKKMDPYEAAEELVKNILR
jgi:putative protein kinase ArgK-like GTPase of G3E family